MRYLIELNDRIFVKSYEVFLFVKNESENISKQLSS